jgi:hypothetical protein
MATTQPGAVSASGKKTLPEGAILTRLSINPSENGGFTVEHHYRAPERKSSSGKAEYCGSSYIEPRDYTFETKESMLQHVSGVFGGKK